jgi:hypothetical protein
METLRRAGRAIWNACSETKQVMEVVVWDASLPEPKEHIPLVLERIGRSPEVQDLVAAIHEEVSRDCIRGFHWQGVCHGHTDNSNFNLD